MHTTTKRHLTAVAYTAAAITLATACTPVAGANGTGPTSGPAGAEVSRDCPSNPDDPYAYVIERGSVGCDKAEDVMEGYQDLATEKDAEVDGYTCSTVLLYGYETDKGTPGNRLSYYFCSGDDGAFRSMVPQGQGLEGTYVHTPDFFIDDGLTEPRYYFTVEQNTCAISAEKAGCQGTVPGDGDDVPDPPNTVELDPKGKPTTIFYGDPRYFPMDQSTPKELKPGEILYAYGFSCQATDDGGATCKTGDNQFTTTSDSLD